MDRGVDLLTDRHSLGFSFLLCLLWCGDKVTVAMEEDEIMVVCGDVVCNDREIKWEGAFRLLLWVFVMCSVWGEG